jgi:hypothetical protein
MFRLVTHSVTKQNLTSSNLTETGQNPTYLRDALRDKRRSDLLAAIVTGALFLDVGFDIML